jgi:hypothetical protein
MLYYLLEEKPAKKDDGTPEQPVMKHVDNNFDDDLLLDTLFTSIETTAAGYASSIYLLVINYRLYLSLKCYRFLYYELLYY